MDALHAQQIAVIAYALLFCVFYSERVLYIALCLGLGLVGGYELVEYAPAVFLPIELIVSIARIFRQVFIGSRA